MIGVSGQFRKTMRKLRRAILRDEPTYYDMFENKGEKYFARLYLHQIQQIITAHPPTDTGIQDSFRILDAGCQAGRLAVPLSQIGHQVTGVDTSDLALRRARRHSKETGTRLRLIRANLGKWLPAQPADSFDIVICTEVLYLRQNYRKLLDGLIRVLRPGGLCFISHRPTVYYLAEALQHQDWNAVDLLHSAKEGTLFGSYYNWQDMGDLELQYRALHVDIIDLTPIGFLSWLIVKPDDLDEAGQESLFKTETALSRIYPDIGRYLLVSGRKAPS